MRTQKFNVTFERITDESAEHGDAAERGYTAQDVTLRDAFEAIEQSTRGDLEAIEPSDSNAAAARWITWYYGRDYESGDFSNYSLHIPDGATPSTRRRIARLCGAIR